MFYLKEAKISGGPYNGIKESGDLSFLLVESEARYSKYKRRWVIVNEKDEIQAYSDDVKEMIDMFELQIKRKEKLPKIVVEDPYFKILLETKGIPYYTTFEFLEKHYPHEKIKKQKHRFVFGKNTKE